ncbi:hypothetical protein SUGI_0299870 [Cryptomeria japonica]|nr:hypothetical protein SUGI_0299870 [Cryptomeria japonica]
MDCNFEFEFNTSNSDHEPVYAEELFLNGQIRTVTQQQQGKSFTRSKVRNSGYPQPLTPLLRRKTGEEKYSFPVFSNNAPASRRNLLWEKGSRSKKVLVSAEEVKLFLKSCKSWKEPRNFSREGPNARSKDSRWPNYRAMEANHFSFKSDEREMRGKPVEIYEAGGGSVNLKAYKSPGEKMKRKKFIFPYLVGCSCVQRAVEDCQVLSVLRAKTDVHSFHPLDIHSYSIQ